jgi:hypothetical protein
MMAGTTIGRRRVAILGLLLAVMTTLVAGCSVLQEKTCTRTPVEARELANAFAGQGFSPVGVHYRCASSEGGSNDEVGIWLVADQPPAGVTRRSDLVRVVAEGIAPAGWTTAGPADPDHGGSGSAASARPADAVFSRDGYRLRVSAVTLHPATVRLYVEATAGNRFRHAGGQGLPARELTGADLVRLSSTPAFTPSVPPGYGAWSGPTGSATESTNGSGLDQFRWESTSSTNRSLILTAGLAPAGYDPATSCTSPYLHNPEVRVACRVLGTTAQGVVVRVPVTTQVPAGWPGAHGNPYAVIGTTLVELQDASLAQDLGVPYISETVAQPFSRAEVLRIFASLDPTLAGRADVPFSGS